MSEYLLQKYPQINDVVARRIPALDYAISKVRRCVTMLTDEELAGLAGLIQDEQKIRCPYPSPDEAVEPRREQPLAVGPARPK